MRKKTVYTINCVVIAFLAFSCRVSNATPADSSYHRYKIYVNAGVYFPETTTTIQINGKNGVGTLLFVEDFLHLDRHPVVFTANALWKISRRSIINARYLHYSAEGDFEKLENSITIRDTVISIGANLNTKWTNDYFGLNYNYAIFAKKDFSAGLSLGMRTSVVSLKMDYELNNISGEYKTSVNIPIILGGLFAEGYMAPRLRGSYSFEFFRLSVGGISGLIYENRFGLEYYIISNVGIGFSYNQILYKIDEVPFSEKFNGHIRYALNGLQVNLHARF